MTFIKLNDQVRNIYTKINKKSSQKLSVYFIENQDLNILIKTNRH